MEEASPRRYDAWEIHLLDGQGHTLTIIGLRATEEEARVTAAELLVTSGSSVFGIQLQKVE